MRVHTETSPMVEVPAGPTATLSPDHLKRARRPDPLIVVRDIHKTYDMEGTSVHALRGAPLAIDRGEFVAIMGASGSGKSTFMNILGLLDEPSSGRYVFEGT